jgi:site-specific DNA-methyltransferase (adenine-specific)
MKYVPMSDDNRFSVIHGDCLEVLRGMDSDSINLTVTSPPYDNLRTYNEYVFDFEGIARELYRVTKSGGVVVWVVGDATIKGSETGTSFRQALFFKDECGFNLHDTMIYQKKGGLNSGSLQAYQQKFEYMFVFSKGKIGTFNLIKDRENIHTETRHKMKRQADGSFAKQVVTVEPFGVRYNIWEFQTGKHHSTSDLDALTHPAIFPEALANDHIISWSNEGDTVLDPFCGSGTTGKMALLNNRKFIGIEISDEYCEIARKRIVSHRNKNNDLLSVMSGSAQAGLF